MTTVDIALRYGRAKSRQDIAAALGCCTADFVMEAIPFRSRAAGRAEVEHDLEVFFDQFPDYQFVPEGHAEGDGTVVLWGRFVATWSGRLPRAVSPAWARRLRLPRRRVDLPAVSVLAVRDGLLAHERFHFDLGELSRQIRVPRFALDALLRRVERHRYQSVRGAAAIRVEHSAVVDAPIDVVFARAFADVRALTWASPAWPLPRATQVELIGAPEMRAGAIRRVHLTSGHVTDERIEEYRPPHRIRYRILNGWGPAIDAVVSETFGEHELAPLADGRTLVTWRGFGVPRSALTRPVAELLAAIILAPMFRRYLRALPVILAEAEPSTLATAA